MPLEKNAGERIHLVRSRHVRPESRNERGQTNATPGLDVQIDAIKDGVTERPHCA